MDVYEKSLNCTEMRRATRVESKVELRGAEDLSLVYSQV